MRHYCVDGTWACGHKKGTRGGDQSASTTAVVQVSCALCQRTKVYKQDLLAYREKVEKRDEEVVAAGFDPHKPMGEWTREEVLAYVAWKERG
jgi:hypothetical protein